MSEAAESKPQDTIGLRRPPLVHVGALLLLLLLLAIGGSATIGQWGDFNVRLAVAYLIPAVALHGWSTWSREPKLPVRGAAWVLALVMTIHTQVLLRPVPMAAIALLAVADLLLYGQRHRVQARISLPAKVTAAGAIAVAILGVALLAAYTRDEIAIRTSIMVVAAGALVVAAAVRPGLRAPQWLLPAIGVHYLAFALVAAPVLPIGPAIAWWLLCASIFVGVIVASQYTMGHEVPLEKGRHRHRVEELYDPRLATYTGEVARFISQGTGGNVISERIERATGREPTGTTLSRLVMAISKGTHATPQERERALRELLEVDA